MQKQTEKTLIAFIYIFSGFYFGIFQPTLVVLDSRALTSQFALTTQINESFTDQLYHDTTDFVHVSHPIRIFYSQFQGYSPLFSGE